LTVRRGLLAFCSLAVVVATITVIGVGTTRPAAADTPFTFTNETFNEATFPPTNWQVPANDGTWAANCGIVTTPATGCAATATVTGGTAAFSQLLFNPSVGIPANLQNPTLSFYSTFSPDATTSGDSIAVMQASVQGGTGDFGPLLNIAGGAGSSDATGTEVLHTVALPNSRTPITFRWTSFGDTSNASSETWAISNVMITGTVPATTYSLSANPIDNTIYPHVVAGTPVTLHLSGSSTPSGDTLQFAISTPPTFGTLGAVTEVDATDATVVYTPRALACPDPTGVAGFICSEVFDYTAKDIEGNVSAPAKIDLDIHPGGPAGQTPGLTAPTAVSYTTLSHHNVLVQGADLSGSVTVGPSAFPDAMELDIQASSGTIELFNAGASGATFLNGTASGDQQIDLSGSKSQLNTAIGEFLYFPPSGTTPTSTINLFAYDLGATGQGPRTGPTSATITVNGIVTNPPPSLALPTGPLAVATNAGPLHFTPGAATGFFLTDAGASPTTSDKVLLSVSGGTLSLPAGDISGSTALVSAQSFGGGGTLDLTGTVGHLNLALGDLSFDPTGLPSGTVTLSASALDPDTTLSSAQGSVPIAVTEAPFAFGASSISTLEDQPATLFLCAAGPTGDPLTFAITTNTAHGTLVAQPSTSTAGSGCSQTLGIEAFLYTPSSGYTGPDGFTYSVTDTATGLVSAGNTLTITVAAHPKPTAYDVSASTMEDAPVDIVLCGNNPDTTPNPTLTFTIEGSSPFGTLTDKGRPSLNVCNQGNVPETFTYTPKVGTFRSDGTDSFTYVVSNGTQSSPATVTIAVVTRTPQVIGVPASVDEDSSIGLNLCSTAPNGPVTFTTVGPTHGAIDQGLAAVNGPACPSGYFNFGYARYTPTALYSGTDFLTFQSTDGTYTSAQALIDITVNRIELPPSATDQTLTDIAPQPVAITLSGTSRQGSTLAYRVTTYPQHGTLSGTAPHLSYTPNIGNGTDSFTFVANDGVADGPPATVTINVVTPNLSSSVCYAGAPIGSVFDDHFACSGSLAPISDPAFGNIMLAHTDGHRSSELRLQDTISNQSSTSDTVTIKAPVATSPWTYFYDVAGSDDTAQITGSGLTVTLGPAGSPTASAYVLIVVFSPLNLPAPPTTSLNVTAVSGNDATVQTSEPVEIQDGSSSPSLSLAQADGSGAVGFPTSLNVAPTLFDNGPAGGVDILAGLTGTGDNTVAVHAEVNVGSTSGITPTFFLGNNDITAKVLAGTEVVTCYAAPVNCPPLKAVLTPGAGGGSFFMMFTLTSTIDGQSILGFVSAQLASSVGPDLYAINPNVGTNVFEPTPVTQIASQAVELSGSASTRVFLMNQGDVADTFTVKAAVTVASGDNSQISIGVSPPGNLNTDLGAPQDQTGALTNGDYQITLQRGDGVVLTVSDMAGASTASNPPQVIFTANSHLESSKIDSFEVTFPTYSYRPDAILTGANGQAIGAGVYQQSYPGPVGNAQQDEYDVDQSARTIDVTLADRGTGPWPANDSVLVKSPTIDPNFVVSYALLQGGSSTDVTAAVNGSGLSLSLGRPGSPTTVLAVTAVASVTAQAGHPGYYPITVTSLSSLPSGLSDVVVIGLYNTGESQLRFAGLPQPEPQDITNSVQSYNYSRVAPFPSVGYAPGATYGAYSDATGQKFAYVSAYDTFDLQVASEKVTHTAYRIQMVDPGPSLTGLPGWERVVFATPYFNGPALSLPADPLAAHPRIMAGSVDVTAAVANGTFTTAPLGTNQTTSITLSFSPPAGDAQRYIPLKFNLINVTTGAIEDVMVIDLSSIVTCSNDANGQQLVTTHINGVPQSLAFQSFDRTATSNPECMQHLSHSYISKLPVVFSGYTPATPNAPAGGLIPHGLWLVPELGGIIRVNIDTLEVTSAYAKGYVDSPLLGPDGLPDPAAGPYGHWYYTGDYPNLDWKTTDGTTGLPVQSNTAMPASPFPLIKPDTADWPNNTMAAARYFQVDTSTGEPLMVGEMHVNVPWYTGDVPLLMYIDDQVGLTLDYAPPPNLTVSLPGDNSVTSDGLFWSTRTDGVVVQGGCLGLPPTAGKIIGIANGYCVLEVTTTYDPISSDPSVQARIHDVAIALKVVGVTIGTPTFNLKSLVGHIDFDPSSGAFQDVVLDGNFGVGPVTPCYADKTARAASGVKVGLAQTAADKACPQNYFTFDAVVTVKKGGFTSDNPTTGYGVQFIGTLSFLGFITLTQVEADVSTEPFNFHFANSPIDVSVDVGIPLSAKLTLQGDVGSSGFSIGLSGEVDVYNETIASASGVFSTKGFGICGDLGPLSVGFGDDWGSSPTFYGSGCTTTQYQVG
jgi:hypothetical protein